MTGEIITQLIGVVITYVWVIAILLFMEKNYRADEKESDQDTRKVLTGNTAFILFIIGMIGVNAIKSVFNITLDFLNITLTKQILWGILAVIGISALLTKNKEHESILIFLGIIVVFTFLILP